MKVSLCPSALTPTALPQTGEGIFIIPEPSALRLAVFTLERYV